MARKLLFSVTMADCDLETFRAGGPGGQHQNKTNSGVRIRHRASGAVGEARDNRSQLQNKKAAWIRMTKTPAFKTWLQRQTSLTDMTDATLRPEDLRIEGKVNGVWKAIG